MKVVLANNLFEPYNRGGAEKVVKEMAKELMINGHEVVILSTKPKNSPSKFLEEKDGFKIYRLESSYYKLSDLNKLSRFFWHLGNFYNFKKIKIYKEILKKERPELLITHNLIGLGFFLIPLASRLNIKQEHFLHDVQLLHPSGLITIDTKKILDSLAAKTYQRISRGYFTSISKVISPSNWLLKEHLSRGFFLKKDFLIKRLKEGKKFENELSDKSKKKDFLFVGQLEKHKGIIFLINAWFKIKKPEIRLNIIGDGKEKDFVEQAVKKDGRLKYLGYLKGELVEEEMKKARALIVPSLCYENSPNTIYEANELNLKVITSNIGGIPEIVKTKDILFEAGKEEDLIDIIIKESN